VFTSLRGYDRSWLRGDLIAGLTVWAVLVPEALAYADRDGAAVDVIPQAMAYATIADLPVEVGLYTCMLPMVVYALLGGSRTLSVSTTSTR